MKRQKKKIVVTGAAGAIGSHVAEALKREGYDVVGIDAYTDYYSPAQKRKNAEDLEASGIPVLELDLAADSLASALEGADIIFHFAAQPGISATTPFDTYVRNNIVATQRLLEQARKISSLSLLVHISTSSVYGTVADSDESAELKPTSHYGVTKLAAEQLALSYYRDKGLPVAVLRLFSVYGERERPEKLYHKVIKSVFDDAEFPLYEGAEDHRRSYTHVSDVVRACLLVVEKIGAVKGEIFNIGTDETITTGEGLAIIEELTGKKIRRKIVPARSGDQKETRAKIGKAKRVLGFSPEVSPRDGLRRQVEWYRTKVHGRLR